MLYKLDEAFLYYFERFSRWWQERTSYDCFWLAKACCMISVFMLWGSIFFMVLYEYPVNQKWTQLANFIVHPILAGALFSRIIETEKTVRSSQKRSLANAERLDWEARIFILFLFSIIFIPLVGSHLLLITSESPLFLIILCMSSYLWIIFGDYFNACDPMPPGQSKIKEWLNQLSASIRAFLNPPKPIHIPS